MFLPNKKVKTLGKYHVIKTLGSGIFKVKLVYDPVSNTYYAAKVCKSSLKTHFLENEALLLRDIGQLDNPNIIKAIDYVENLDGFNKKHQSEYNSLQTTTECNFKSALIMELASNETLFEFIYHNGKFEEKLGRSYFKQLVRAVGALHANGYIHRDLKPENILLDDKFQIKLADFGFGRAFNESNEDSLTTKCGSESYIAPEMYVSKQYSGTKIDSFALGVLLFIFVFGRPPFYKASEMDVFYRHIANERPDKFWAIYEDKFNGKKEFDPEFKALVNALLKRDPQQRIHVNQIEDFEWMKREVYSDDELPEIMRPLKEVCAQAGM